MSVSVSVLPCVCVFVLVPRSALSIVRHTERGCGSRVCVEALFVLVPVFVRGACVSSVYVP